MLVNQRFSETEHAERDSLYYSVDSVEPESSECPPDIRI